MYVRFGVPEYWMADLRRRTVEIHRLAPDGAAYGPSEVFRPGQRATTSLLPALAVDVTALFDE